MSYAINTIINICKIFYTKNIIQLALEPKKLATLIIFNSEFCNLYTNILALFQFFCKTIEYID